MIRLRYTCRGWFKLAFQMRTGRVLRDGTELADEYGCFEREFWVGPFPTASDATTHCA